MAASHGLWTKIYESIWDHEKTSRAAQVLAEGGVPSEVAAFVVVGVLHRLMCWALRNGDDGATGSLTDARLAMRMWPESVEYADEAPHETGALLRLALRSGGYLKGEGADERLHEFRVHNAKLIQDREAKRAKRASSKAESNDNPSTVGNVSHDRLGREEQEPEAVSEAVQEGPLSESESSSDADGLLQRMIERTMWGGKRGTMRAALEQLRARGLSDADIESRFDALGSGVVGMKPYDLRDSILAQDGGGQRSRFSLPAAPDYGAADDHERTMAASMGMSVAEYQAFRNEQFYGSNGTAS